MRKTSTGQGTLAEERGTPLPSKNRSKTIKMAKRLLESEFLVREREVKYCGGKREAASSIGKPMGEGGV